MLFSIVGLIERDEPLEVPKSPIPRNKSFGTLQREFQLEDACDFVKFAAEVSCEIL